MINTNQFNLVIKQIVKEYIKHKQLNENVSLRGDNDKKFEEFIKDMNSRLKGLKVSYIKKALKDELKQQRYYNL